MIFTAKDRLVFDSIMPESSDFMGTSVMKDLLSRIPADRDFKEQINFRFDEQIKRYVWDDVETEFDLSTVEISFLKEQSTHLDNEKKINLDNFDLIKKIKEL